MIGFLVKLPFLACCGQDRAIFPVSWLKARVKQAVGEPGWQGHFMFNILVSLKVNHWNVLLSEA